MSDAGSPVDGVVATYRSPVVVQVLNRVVPGLFLVVAAVLVVREVAGMSGPPVWFALGWVLAVCFIGYGLWFRVALSLAVSADTLAWRTPVRRASAPLPTLRSVGPQSWGSNALLIRFDTRSVLLLAGRGVQPFIETLHELAPQADISSGWQVRLQERIPWTRSGFRRRP